MNSIHLLLYSNAIAKCLVAVNISERSLRRLSSLLSHWVGIVYLLLCYILVNWLLHHPVAVFVENLFWLIWKTCWWSFFFTQIWLLVLHNHLEIPFFFVREKNGIIISENAWIRSHFHLQVHFQFLSTQIDWLGSTLWSIALDFIIRFGFHYTTFVSFDWGKNDLIAWIMIIIIQLSVWFF